VNDGEVVVRSLLSFFEHCWQDAVELDNRTAGAEPSGLTDQELAVVKMLAAGMKDDTIARSLAISVRTVSRLIGNVTRQLEADSRFQAGVRAAQLGWV
jgi:DNA-binding NarL/FixJ family response regulator